MLLDTEALPLVAMEFMNEVHLEDAEIVNTIFGLILAYERAPSPEAAETLDRTYREWIDHTVSHFAREEEQMLAKGFPPYPKHKGEHDWALSRMREVFAQWQHSRDIMVLKIYFIEEVSRWLVQHILTMDTVTARFLSQAR